MSELFTSEALISLFTLTLMEIILGIDNVIFISIVSSRLPKEQQGKGRSIGLILALLVRVGLLFGISWLVGLQEPILTLPFLEIFKIDAALSGRDLILLLGGLFLLWKSVSEIHHKVQGASEDEAKVKAVLSMGQAIVQIVLIDIVFSFDSILTAVGLVKSVYIMIIAVILSMGVMLAFSGKIAHFVDTHPSIKLLALSFLVLIGFLLVIEGFGEHVPKGYVYFAMAFAFIVELLNMRMQRNTSVLSPSHADEKKAIDDMQ